LGWQWIIFTVFESTECNAFSKTRPAVTAGKVQAALFGGWHGRPSPIEHSQYYLGDQF